MSGFRARDDDRSATVAALEDAYVDGQIDADEREWLVTEALQARHVDTLQQLLSDLRGEKVDQARALMSDRPAAHPATSEPTQRANPILMIVLALAAMAAIGVVVHLSTRDDPDSGSSSSGAFDAPMDPDDLSDDLVEVAEEVQEDIDDHIAEYGASFATFTQTWTLDSNVPYLASWTVETAADGANPARLNDLDTAALVTNLDYARTSLGVEDAESATVTISATDAVVHIEVANRGGDTATLTTTMGGEITAEEPFGN